MNTQNPTFAIISLGFLGDTILVEPLCQNIRNNYKDNKIIVIANDIFKDAVKGFRSVDEVFGYNKTDNHKGIQGYFKFRKEFPYKNKIDYAIITHPHERSLILAKLIGAKNIISLPVKNSCFNFLINNKVEYIENEIRNTYKAHYNLKYIEHLFTPELLPVQYIRDDINYNEIKQKFELPEHYLVLSPISKDLVKDCAYTNIKEFIEKCKTEVVLVGTQKANEIANQLKADNIKFIDLTNKTTITELGAVIKMSDICVSVDTGTLHLSYAQGVNTIGLFFNTKMVDEWAPRDIKNVKILNGKKIVKNNSVVNIEDINADTVLNEVNKIIMAKELK